MMRMGITATIEGMKVVFKTGCYGDFHIMAMAALPPQSNG
ncbi:hypothetical protein MTBBW1_1760005 [Desulfamplus magnetovallimortis]|uniref:Uncharacterized protein n=1 Tax=Desulfamplus magnetovallimortis TaxID=1246637 RepID=A0A1W1HA82_9BACT|nr:hypothetical protein MTBBW1_1760005 [Desulfamplus magnetovallimortis]